MKWSRQTTELTLDGAERLLWYALEYAAELKATVAISVVDRAGYLLCSARMHGAPGVSADISSNKAKTSAQLKIATRSLQQIVDRSRGSYLSIGSLCPVSGGVPFEMDGEVIGAIGVSGGTETIDNDIAGRAVQHFQEQLVEEQGSGT